MNLHLWGTYYNGKDPQQISSSAAEQDSSKVENGDGSNGDSFDRSGIRFGIP